MDNFPPYILYEDSELIIESNSESSFIKKKVKPTVSTVAPYRNITKEFHSLKQSNLDSHLIPTTFNQKDFELLYQYEPLECLRDVISTNNQSNQFIKSIVLELINNINELHENHLFIPENTSLQNIFLNKETNKIKILLLNKQYHFSEKSRKKSIKNNIKIIHNLIANIEKKTKIDLSITDQIKKSNSLIEISDLLRENAPSLYNKKYPVEKLEDKIFNFPSKSENINFPAIILFSPSSNELNFASNKIKEQKNYTHISLSYIDHENFSKQLIDQLCIEFLKTSSKKKLKKFLEIPNEFLYEIERITPEVKKILKENNPDLKVKVDHFKIINTLLSIFSEKKFKLHIEMSEKLLPETLSECLTLLKINENFSIIFLTNDYYPNLSFLKKYISATKLKIPALKELEILNILNTISKKQKNKELSNFIHKKTKGRKIFVFNYFKKMIDNNFIFLNEKNKFEINYKKSFKIDIKEERNLELINGYDNLNNSEKNVLDISACLGEKFKFDVLKKLIEKTEIINELISKDFLIESKVDELKFKNIYFYSYIYSKINEDKKRAIHTLIYKNLLKHNKKDVISITDHINASTATIKYNANTLDTIRFNVASCLFLYRKKEYKESFKKGKISLLLMTHNEITLSKKEAILIKAILESCYQLNNIETAHLILHQIKKIPHEKEIQELINEYFFQNLLLNFEIKKAVNFYKKNNLKFSNRKKTKNLSIALSEICSDLTINFNLPSQEFLFKIGGII